MCSSGNWIHNKYTNNNVFVKCGHCPSCLQEKANRRIELIQNHTRLTGLTCLFITLTYSNDYIPYIQLSDIYKNPNHTFINVYRDYKVRYDFRSRSFKRWRCKHALIQVPLDKTLSRKGLVEMRKKVNGVYHPVKNKVSVIFYKDVQNYFKLLRTNLERMFNYTAPFKFFICTEYGGKYKRAHAHCLVWCPYGDVEKFYHAHLKSWAFCGRDRKKRGFEIARDASKYCASYVNCLDSLSVFLQDYFPPKCSRSFHLGYPDSVFTLDLLRSMVARQDFSVSLFDDYTGKSRTVTLPAHVIDRFFPKFKGQSRLTDFETINILTCPERYSEYEKTLSLFIRKEEPFSEGQLKVTDYDRPCDLQTFVNKISLGYSRFFSSLSGLTDRTDYALEYIRTWNAFNSYLIKNSHRIVADNHQNDCYTYLNIEDYPNLENKSLDGLYNDHIILNPNEFPLNRQQSDKYSYYFFLRDKSKVLSDSLPQSIN